MAMVAWLLPGRPEFRQPRVVVPVAAGAVAGDPAGPPGVVRPGRPKSVPGWTRAETAAQLQRYFSRELLQWELELEQARYRGEYWQPEPGLAEMQSVETRRAEGVRRLTTEMNALLEEMHPGEPGEPLALTAFFSLDRPAPNLAVLSESSRAKMEEVLLARDPSVEADPVREAELNLTGDELAAYLRWNAPPSAALRNRLAGFEASEAEFTAILKWQSVVGSDDETVARAALHESLGAGRLEQLDHLLDPAVHTAAQDLYRLGLPLAQAGWLADFRGAAVAQLQQSWRNPALTAAQKEAEVAALRDAFRQELTWQLRPLAESAELLP